MSVFDKDQSICYSCFDLIIVGLSVLFLMGGDNHPSGNLQPSKEDIDITQKIVEAARILGLRLIDHIIFSKKGYFSFLESGRL